MNHFAEDMTLESKSNFQTSKADDDSSLQERSKLFMSMNDLSDKVNFEQLANENRNLIHEHTIVNKSD